MTYLISMDSSVTTMASISNSSSAEEQALSLDVLFESILPPQELYFIPHQQQHLLNENVILQQEEVSAPSTTFISMDDIAELDFILNENIASSVVASQQSQSFKSAPELDVEIDILQRAIDLSAEMSSDDGASPLQPSGEITYEDLNLLDECYQEMVKSEASCSKKRSLDESDAEDEYEDDDPFLGSSDEENTSRIVFSPPAASVASPISPASNNKRRKSSDSGISGSGGDKKESNKAAATKYRMKKVREKGELFERRDELVKRNACMKKKIEDVQCEINYIKSLLLEALISKNGK